MYSLTNKLKEQKGYLIPNHRCRWDSKPEKLSHSFKHTDHGDSCTALATFGRNHHVQSKHSRV